MQFPHHSTAGLSRFQIYNGCAINAIFVLQKRAIRSVYNMGARDSLRDKFKEINILTVASLYILENVLYVKKNISDFPRLGGIHCKSTRNKSKLVTPTCRLHKVYNSFVGQSIMFFNKIPENVQELSVNKFKRLVKQRLCEKAYYTTKDFLDDRTEWV